MAPKLSSRLFVSRCALQMLVLLQPMPEHLAKLLLFQVSSLDVTLTRLEKTYDKNVVLLTRREYLKVQLQLEECERRHQEIFNPNIGKHVHTATRLSLNPPRRLNLHLVVPSQDLVHTRVSSGSASPS